MTHRSLAVPALLILLGGAGCATVPADSLKPAANLEPVEVGTGASEKFDAANTILHFPAGKPLPFHITAAGSIFSRPIDHTENFVLNRDIYLWRNMVSFDGKSWKPADEVFDGKVEFFFNPKNVRFNAEYNLADH